MQAFHIIMPLHGVVVCVIKLEYIVKVDELNSNSLIHLRFEISRIFTMFSCELKSSIVLY